MAESGSVGQESALDTEVAQSLYAKRQKIYPREVHGLFARLRTLGVLSLLGIFYGLPWLRWDDHQALLFDLPARKFYIFGITLWPQDFIYLAFLLIIAGLTLFFFTAIAGRIWCGYACPQTVWTEAFLWIERMVEGDRPKQIKLDKAPMSGRKFRIKFTKHAIWIILSLWTGFTFVGYFTPILDLQHRVATLALGGWETFWILFYGFATYGNAGWMREQVCKYMCPYARFQSAMFDKDTLIIAYDEARGDPRGSRKRSADPGELGLGDCIDCTMCVQVCPTGIDIRNGLQYECIACSACIDACDDVMDKMGYERGLVRYTTENAKEGKGRHILRPRIIIYGLILLSMLVMLGYGLMSRVPVALDVIRDRNRLFNETEYGLIENVYVLKLMNMDERPHEFQIKATGLPDLRLVIDNPKIVVEPGEVQEVAARVQVDEADIKQRSSIISFAIQAADDGSVATEEEARFLGPRP